MWLTHRAEVIIWEHDDKVGGIREASRVVDTLPGLSRIRHVNLGQDRVEGIFIDAMKENNGLEVDRLLEPTSLVVDEKNLGNPDAFPVTVTLKRLPAPKELANGDVQSGMYRSNLFTDESQTKGNDVEGDHSGEEVVHCKYLVGCDGARSWVRKTLGYRLEGDSNNVYWGAFDAVIDSDLPTGRMKHMAHSKDDGTVLMVPREDSMIRIYTQMGTLADGERVDREAVTLEKLCAKTQAVLKPYKIEFPYVDWYTCYEIGQRVCDTFTAYDDHVFIAGDACHTHSPKAGQGMNVSMMDTFNLGWKIASVLRGQSKPDILHTYQLERQYTAKELIDFDYKWSRLFTGQIKPGKDADEGEMRAAWEQSIKFTSGTGVVYAPDGLLVLDQPNASKLAKNITVGGHFENHQVVGAFNAHSIKLQAELKADGRWRVLIFPGDVRESDALDALTNLGNQLQTIVQKYNSKDADLDEVIQVLTVFKTAHREIQYLAQSLPEVLIPRRKPYNIRAFDTLYCDEPSHHDGDGKAYAGYGIDPSFGCVVVCRPDQHVSGVFGMSQGKDIAAFFDRFMVQQ